MADKVVIQKEITYEGAQDILVCIEGVSKKGPYKFITVDKSCANNPLLFNILVKSGVKNIDLNPKAE